MKRLGGGVSPGLSGSPEAVCGGLGPGVGEAVGLSAGTRRSQVFPDVEVGRGLVLESRFQRPCQDSGCPDIWVSRCLGMVVS